MKELTVNRIYKKDITIQLDDIDYNRIKNSKGYCRIKTNEAVEIVIKGKVISLAKWIINNGKRIVLKKGKTNYRKSNLKWTITEDVYYSTLKYFKNFNKRLNKEVAYLNVKGVNILINKEFYDILSIFNWRFIDGYIKTSINIDGIFKTVALYRLILGLGFEDKLHADHIDHNKDNNVLDNLRKCTLHENNFNKDIQKNNISGYTGIHKTKIGNYRVHISINKTERNAGTYKTLEEAIRVRKELVNKYYKIKEYETI